MLSYRGTTLVFLSTIIWGFEYLLAYLTFNVFFNIDFNLNIFINYINNTFALSNIENIIISHFNLIIMIFVFAIIYIALNIVKRKK